MPNVSALRYLNNYSFDKVPVREIELQIESASNSSNQSITENDTITLECCSNADAYPEPFFAWSKAHNNKSQKLLGTDMFNRLQMKDNKVCSHLKVESHRSDNKFTYSCSVINEATKQPLSKNISLSVQCKFI